MTATDSAESLVSVHSLVVVMKCMSLRMPVGWSPTKAKASHLSFIGKDGISRFSTSPVQQVTMADHLRGITQKSTVG